MCVSVIIYWIKDYHCYWFSRYAGDEWLVTLDDAESYIPEVSEVNLIDNSYRFIAAVCILGMQQPDSKNPLRYK